MLALEQLRGNGPRRSTRSSLMLMGVLFLIGARAHFHPHDHDDLHSDFDARLNDHDHSDHDHDHDHIHDHPHDHDHDHETYSPLDSMGGFSMSGEIGSPGTDRAGMVLPPLGSAFGLNMPQYKEPKHAHSCEHKRVVAGLEEEAREYDKVSKEAHMSLNHPALKLKGRVFEEEEVEELGAAEEGGRTQRRRRSRMLLDAYNPSTIRIYSDLQVDPADLADAASIDIVAAQTQIDFVVNTLIPQAVSQLQRVIRVKRPVPGTFYLDRICSVQIVIGGVTQCYTHATPTTCLFATHNTDYFGPYTEYNAQGPPTTYDGGFGLTDTDLVLYVSSTASRGSYSCGATTIALGGPCIFDSQTDRPLAVNINFCPLKLAALDINDPVAVGVFIDTAVHEIIHGLAFTTTLYSKYVSDANTGANTLAKLATVVSNTTITYTNGGPAQAFSLIATPKVAQTARTQLGCSDTTKIPGAFLENEGDAFATAGVHWDMKFFNQELMIGIGASRRQYFSALTMALLEDSGWYTVNYNYAEGNSYALNAGCDFVAADCRTLTQTRVNTASDTQAQLLVRQGFCTSDATSDTRGCGPDRTYFGNCRAQTLASACPMIQAFGDGECNDPRNNEDERSYIGQYYGTQSRCLAYRREFTADSPPQWAGITRRQQTLFYDVGCFYMTCKSGKVMVNLYGKDYECPANGYLDLTIHPELEFQKGQLGPCPDPASFCSNLACTALNDCNNNGRCVNGQCSCFSGWVGADCSLQACTQRLGDDGVTIVDSCGSDETKRRCDLTTGMCVGLQPPPPPPTPIPPPPPKSPVTYTGVIMDGPLHNCQVYNDINGNGVADVYEFQSFTDRYGYWSVRTQVDNPVWAMDPTIPGMPCRDIFTGVRYGFPLRNIAGGIMLTPLTTVHSHLNDIHVAANTVSKNDNAAIALKVNQCFNLPAAVNILTYDNTTSFLDPLRQVALYNATNSSKLHLYTNMALGNALQIISPTLEGALGLQTLTAFERTSLAGNALLRAVANLCFTNGRFNSSNQSDWESAALYAVSIPLGNGSFITSNVSAPNQCCLPNNVACCTRACPCRFYMLQDATVAAAQVNQLLYNMGFLNRFKTGLDVVADYAKVQYIGANIFGILMKKLVAGSTDLFTWRNNTGVDNLNVLLTANATFGGVALLRALGISATSPPPPPRLKDRKKDWFLERVGGVYVFIYIIIGAVIVVILFLVLLIWRCLSKQAALKAHETDEDILKAHGQRAEGPYAGPTGGIATGGALAAVGDDGVIYLIEDANGDFNTKDSGEMVDPNQVETHPLLYQQSVGLDPYQYSSAAPQGQYAGQPVILQSPGGNYYQGQQQQQQPMYFYNNTAAAGGYAQPAEGGFYQEEEAYDELGEGYHQEAQYAAAPPAQGYYQAQPQQGMYQQEPQEFGFQPQQGQGNYYQQQGGYQQGGYQQGRR